MHRAAYEKKAAQRREVAKRLRAQGKKQREIAEHLGVSERQVRNFLKG